jgi:hypothetical protein
MTKALLIGSFLKNNKKTILYTLLGILAVWGIYKIYKYFTKDKPAPTNLTNPLTGGTVPSDFNPDAYARRLEEEFAGIQLSNEGRNNILKDINELNDNSLITLHNYWNENYFNRTSWGFEYGSIYSLIDDDFGPSVTFGNNVNYFGVMLDRLRNLNLY